MLGFDLCLCVFTCLSVGGLVLLFWVAYLIAYVLIIQVWTFVCWFANCVVCIGFILLVCCVS